jgi:predicted transcriptional regulator
VTHRPTDAELAVLRVLWQSGPSTVRAVYTALGGDTAYTTTLTTMQRMVDKGLLDRDTSTRSHVFRAAVAEAATRTGMVTDLADKVFAGSAAQLAMAALSSSPIAPDELAALRQLLDDLDVP